MHWLTAQRKLMALVLLLVGLSFLPNSHAREDINWQTKVAYQGFLEAVGHRAGVVLKGNQTTLQRYQLCFNSEVTKKPDYCEVDRETVLTNIKINFPLAQGAWVYKDLFNFSATKVLFHRLREKIYQQITEVLPPKEQRLRYPTEDYGQNFVSWGQVRVTDHPFSHIPEVHPFINETHYLNAMCTPGDPHLHPSEGTCENLFHLGVTDLYRQTCKEAMTKIQDSPSAFDIKTHKTLIRICDEMTLYYENGRFDFAPLPITSTNYNEYEIFRELLFWEDILREFDKVSRKYGQVLSTFAKTTPYAVLVSNEDPSDKELYSVFDKMLKASRRAQDRHHEIMQVLGGGRPNYGFIRRNVVDHLPGGHWYNTQKERDMVLSLMDYTPIVKYVAEKAELNEIRELQGVPLPEGYSWDKVAEELTDKRTWSSMRTLGIDLAVLFASEAVICWGGGKVVSWLARGLKASRGFHLNRAFCVGSLEAAFNIGWVYKSYQNYLAVYDDILASIDAENRLRELEQLKSADLDFVIESLSAPIGIGLGRLAVKSSQVTAKGGRGALNQLMKNRLARHLSHKLSDKTLTVLAAALVGHQLANFAPETLSEVKERATEMANPTEAIDSIEGFDPRRYEVHWGF